MTNKADKKIIPNSIPGYIGIDLGTTYCSISYVGEDGEIHLVSDSDGNSLFPSFIHFVETDKGVTFYAGIKGKEAVSKDPANVISSYKTYMGVQDPETGTSPVLKVIKGKDITAETCSMFMLKYLKTVAETFFGEEITHAVITVPAYFSEVQKQATIESAKNSGLVVLRLVSEPTAAAHFYNIGLNNKDEFLTLAFDLGGGTFDLTIIEHIREVDGSPTSSVIDTSGDMRLGGDDIDKALLHFMYKKKKDISTLSQNIFDKLQREAENAKKELSIAYNNKDMDFVYKPTSAYLKEVSIEEFLEIIRPFIDRCLKLTDELLTRNKLKDKIDEIVLVGGSTRLPLIREGLIELFNSPKFNENYFKDYLISPDYSVSKGAATLLNHLITGESGTIEDVVAKSLKLKTVEGIVTLVPKGQPLPTRMRKSYTNAHDDQTIISIDILEGSGVAVGKGLEVLGTLNIPITKAKANTVNVLVTVEITESGVIEVSVQAKNKKNKLTISRHFDADVSGNNTVTFLEEMKSGIASGDNTDLSEIIGISKSAPVRDFKEKEKEEKEFTKNLQIHGKSIKKTVEKISKIGK